MLIPIIHGVLVNKKNIKQDKPNTRTNQYIIRKNHDTGDLAINNRDNGEYMLILLSINSSD